MSSPADTSPAGQDRPTRPSERASGPSARPQPPSSPSSETRPPAPTPERTAENPPPHNQADQLAAVSSLLGSLDPETGAVRDGATGPAPPAPRGADGRFTPADPPEEEAASDAEAVEAEAGAAEDGAAEGLAPTTPPRTLRELAERLDVEPEALYDLELTTGDGEAVSLGALKDAWAGRQEGQRETARREQALDAREAALQADQRLLGMLAGDLKGKVSPQALQALREKAQASEVHERQQLLAAMPELQDQAAFNAFREGTVELLRQYGFRPAEMAIGDHRILVVLRDFMRTKQRLDRLLAYEPERKPPQAARPNGRTATPSGTKQLVETARRTGKQADQVAAVAGLIGAR